MEHLEVRSVPAGLGLLSLSTLASIVQPSNGLAPGEPPISNLVASALTVATTPSPGGGATPGPVQGPPGSSSAAEGDSTASLSALLGLDPSPLIAGAIHADADLADASSDFSLGLGGMNPLGVSLLLLAQDFAGTDAGLVEDLGDALNLVDTSLNSVGNAVSASGSGLAATLGDVLDDVGVMIVRSGLDVTGAGTGLGAVLGDVFDGVDDALALVGNAQDGTPAGVGSIVVDVSNLVDTTVASVGNTVTTVGTGVVSTVGDVLDVVIGDGTGGTGGSIPPVTPDPPTTPNPPVDPGGGPTSQPSGPPSSPPAATRRGTDLAALRAAIESSATSRRRTDLSALRADPESAGRSSRWIDLAALRADIESDTSGHRGAGRSLEPARSEWRVGRRASRPGRRIEWERLVDIHAQHTAGHQRNRPRERPDAIDHRAEVECDAIGHLRSGHPGPAE